MMLKILLVWLSVGTVCAWGSELDTIEVKPMPLSMFSVKLWKPQQAKFKISADMLKKSPAIALYLELRDFDEVTEGVCSLNGFGPFDMPTECLSNADIRGGFLFIPKSCLKAGENIIDFYRCSNLNGTTKGFEVVSASVFLGNRDELNKQLTKKRSKLLLKTSRSTPVSERHTYNDNFNDEKKGKCFSHWTHQTGKWQITNDNGNKQLALLEKNSNAIIFLHAYGQNTKFTGQFTIKDKKPIGSIYFAARCSLYPNYLVKAGYDFGEKRWKIIERFYTEKERLLQSVPGELATLKKHNFSLELNGVELKLLCDNKVVASTTAITNLNYGRNGFELKDLTADFDNIKLISEGYPIDGIKEQYLNVFGNGCILQLKNGDLLLQTIGPINYFLSSDQGLSWHPQKADYFPIGVKWGEIGIERLPDGRLIHLHMRYAKKAKINTERNIFATLSSDEGKSWGKHIKISNGGVNNMVNGKITVTRSGRILTPVTTSEGYVGEKDGGVAVYYSDNGNDWKKSKTVFSIANTGINLQEPQIVELSDGRLMMFMRSNKRYLYASYSSDKGETWGAPVKLPLPSVMCAFGVKKASSGEIFIVWTFDDSRQHPEDQFPRERLGLARSYDDGKHWKYLGDLDDFGGNFGRFMNAGLNVTKKYLFPVVTVWHPDPKTRYRMKIWRIERSKLKDYPKFPVVH